MSSPQQPTAALLVLAAFSRYDSAIRWAREWSESQWGSVALESPPFRFTETTYYARDMGDELTKTFFAFERLIDPAELAGLKLQAIQGEQEYARAHDHDVVRPLNLDPGYLTQAKLILASTKDHAHRIYLQHGIYAEITLRYQHGAWHAWDWTYPDYRRDDYHQFFDQCRDYLRSQRHV